MNFVWAIVILIVSYAITALLTPAPKKPTDAIASALKDFEFPIPDEGASQAVTFGDCWTANWQVLWFGNMKTQAIRAASSGGKK